MDEAEALEVTSAVYKVVSIKLSLHIKVWVPGPQTGFGTISCGEQRKMGSLTELVSIVELGAAKLDSADEVA